MNQSPASSPVASAALSEKVKEAVSGLGAIVFWEMSDTRVSPDDLRLVLASEGLQHIDVPDIDPDAAVRRAARTWATGRAGVADKYRGDVVSTGDASAVKVCILHREETKAGKGKEARWETVESVTLDLATRTWTATAWTNEVQGFVDAADQFIKFHDHNFIRPNVIQKRLVDMRAFSLKASSGLWYVTQESMGDLAALQRVVGRIGGSQMYVIHVGPTSDSRDAISTAARTALTESLNELETKLEGWIESSRKIRTDAVETTMAEFQELVDRADLYSGALQVRMDDLSARIEVARDRARTIIDGNFTSHADPSTKPLGKRALQLAEVVDAAFSDGPFTAASLEDAVGAAAGTLHTHLRDLTRHGKIHRSGKDAAGAALFAVGAARDPQAEADGMDEVQVSTGGAQQELGLLPAKQSA